MNRQVIINSAAGGVIGLACATLIGHGHILLAVAVFIAWIIGIINSMIPVYTYDTYLASKESSAKKYVEALTKKAPNQPTNKPNEDKPNRYR